MLTSFLIHTNPHFHYCGKFQYKYALYMTAWILYVIENRKNKITEKEKNKKKTQFRVNVSSKLQHFLLSDLLVDLRNLFTWLLLYFLEQFLYYIYYVDVFLFEYLEYDNSYKVYHVNEGINWITYEWITIYSYWFIVIRLID